MQQQMAGAAQPGAPGQPPGGGYPANTQGIDTGVPTGQGYDQNAGGSSMSAATGQSGVSLREMMSGQDVTGAQIA